MFKLLMQQTNRWEVIVQPPIEVLPPRYGQIYISNFSPPPSTKQYDVTIGNFPNCICDDFIQMMAGSLGGRGKWVHCKHLYFILQNVMYCGQIKPFLHFLTWSQNEIQCIMNHVKVIILKLPTRHWFLCLQITLDSTNCIFLLPKQDHVYLCHVSCHLCLAKE